MQFTKNTFVGGFALAGLMLGLVFEHIFWGNFSATSVGQAFANVAIFPSQSMMIFLDLMGLDDELKLFVFIAIPFHFLFYWLVFAMGKFVVMHAIYVRSSEQ